FTCVWYGMGNCVWSQKIVAFGFDAAANVALIVSGRSQLFDTCLPVLVPPNTVAPQYRAMSCVSNPLNTRESRLELRSMTVPTPLSAGLMLYTVIVFGNVPPHAASGFVTVRHGLAIASGVKAPASWSATLSE